MDLADVLAIWGQRDVLIVVGLGLLSVCLWRLPVVGWLFYPFRLFNTFIHELSHGFAAILTGGSFHRVVVYPGRSGFAIVRGANWLVVSAGYLGPPLFGGLLTYLSRSRLPPQGVLIWMGMILAALFLGFVRNLFGIMAGLLLAAGLYAAGLNLEAQAARNLLLLLAVQMMLSAITSVFDLVRYPVYRGAAPIQTDAQVMAERTGVPAVIWALLWSLIALGILCASITLAYRDAPLP